MHAVNRPFSPMFAGTSFPESPGGPRVPLSASITAKQQNTPINALVEIKRGCGIRVELAPISGNVEQLSLAGETIRPITWHHNRSACSVDLIERIYLLVLGSHQFPPLVTWYLRWDVCQMDPGGLCAVAPVLEYRDGGRHERWKACHVVSWIYLRKQARRAHNIDKT